MRKAPNVAQQFVFQLGKNYRLHRIFLTIRTVLEYKSVNDYSGDTGRIFSRHFWDVQFAHQ